MTRPRLVVPTIAAAFLVACSIGAAAQRPTPVPPQDARSAAQAGLSAFLGVEGGRGVERLGFRDPADAARATVGEGFQVFTVDPNRLLDPKETDLSALVVPTGTWQFLVQSEGTARSLITVERVAGAWTAVAVGASGLADQLATLIARWPPAAHRLRLIRIFQAHSDLIEIASEGRVRGVVPFTSARVALKASRGFDPGDVRGSGPILEALRPAVRAGLGQ